MHYTWKNIKSEYKNNEFKIIAPTRNETFNLPNGSYTIAGIQDYFEFVIKKHENILDDNPPILIYPSKIKNRIAFKIKTGYELELLSNETLQLLGDGPIIDTDKNGKNVPKIKQVISVLMHCNVVQNNYQQDSKLSYSFLRDKQFGQLLVIEPKALIGLKTIDSIFDYMDIWFADQDNRSLQIEDSVNISLIVRT